MLLSDQPMRILHVEDNAMYRDLVRGFLCRNLPGEYEIFECASSDDAISVYNAVTPDWILMDIMAGVSDGLTAAQSQEVERKRIASGLHDSLGQNLLVLKNILDQSATNNELKTDVRKELKELSELAQLSLNEVREISFDLHPHVLDRLGLQRAIETMVEKLNSSFPVVVTARFEGPSFKLGNQLEIGIYRIAQEALSNVVKHSEARTASVMINARNGVLELKVVDDGRGFDAPAHLARPPGRWSLGLVNIAERVRLLNGTYSINSRTGEGTTLTVHIPLNSHPASSK